MFPLKPTCNCKTHIGWATFTTLVRAGTDMQKIDVIYDMYIKSPGKLPGLFFGIECYEPDQKQNRHTRH